MLPRYKLKRVLPGFVDKTNVVFIVVTITLFYIMSGDLQQYRCNRYTVLSCTTAPFVEPSCYWIQFLNLLEMSFGPLQRMSNYALLHQTDGKILVCPVVNSSLTVIGPFLNTELIHEIPLLAALYFLCSVPFIMSTIKLFL